MSSWVVIPCLLTLRGEFNQVSPFRDKGADGTIGDSAHTSTSDHTPDEDSDVLRKKDADGLNEVHALDIDSSGPWPDGKRGDIAGSWFDTQIHRLIAEEKRRWLDPNDMCRLRYVIWKGHIYHLDRDFEPAVYTGSSDPHINHVHFSGRYETRAESDTRPWGVWEDDMPTVDEIIKGFRNTKEVLSDTNVAIIAKETASQLTPVLNQLLALAAGEAAERPPTVEEISAGVVAALGQLQTPEEIARLLLPVLGDKAAAVGQLLAVAPAKS